MGLSNSRLRSRSHRPRVNRSSSLSSVLLCGASSSRVEIQMEEHFEISHEVQTPRLELSSDLNTGQGTNSSNCFEGSNNRNSNLRVSGDDDGSSRCSNHRASSSSTLFKQRQSLDDTLPLDVSANPNVVNGQTAVENRAAEQTAVGSFGSGSRSSAQIRPFGGETVEEEALSGLGFLVSQVDVLSISPNVLPNSNSNENGGNNRVARRSGRRMIWDAFSRRSSGRVPDSPTYVFSMEDRQEGVGSRDGWVFGLSSDLFDDVDGSDSGWYQRHSSSEVWERLRSGFGESGRRTTVFCPSGIHLDGTCSCESLLRSEESSTRSSISRIIMLAEALFELQVLDGIHREPVSLSLSMVSSPAPSSLVDSFPLKSHSKISKGKGCEDIAECYICLAEYEEGDKIRVLPCHHEYHMLCVDKWLKEIHGVCPLCRGDVREGLTDCSVSNSEISV